MDSNPPVTTNKDGCAVASAKLIAQLKSGAKVTVRRYEWPNDWSVDEVGDLAGFSKAMDAVARARGV